MKSLEMSCVVGFTALLLAAKSAHKGLPPMLMYSIVILPASLRWENFSTCWASKTSWRSQNWLLWTLKLAAPMLLPTAIAACKAERISNCQPVLVKWCQQGSGKAPKWIFWRKSLQTVRLTPKLRATDLTKPPKSLIFKFVYHVTSIFSIQVWLNEGALFQENLFTVSCDSIWVLKIWFFRICLLRFEGLEKNFPQCLHMVLPSWEGRWFV